jgi:hypothetical protein
MIYVANSNFGSQDRKLTQSQTEKSISEHYQFEKEKKSLQKELGIKYV